MKRHAFPMMAMAGLLLGCGQPADIPAPDAAPARSGEADVLVEAPVAATVLSAADQRRVCLAGLSAIHGQDVQALRVDGVDGEIVEASWPAPVDGGRRYADCRVAGETIEWRPTQLPSGQASSWMSGPDPVVAFELDGDTITITQTFPDDTRSQTTLTVPAQPEAR